WRTPPGGAAAGGGPPADRRRDRIEGEKRASEPDSVTYAGALTPVKAAPAAKPRMKPPTRRRDADRGRRSSRVRAEWHDSGRPTHDARDSNHRGRAPFACGGAAR